MNTIELKSTLNSTEFSSNFEKKTENKIIYNKKTKKHVKINEEIIVVNIKSFKKYNKIKLNNEKENKCNCIILWFNNSDLNRVFDINNINELLK